MLREISRQTARSLPRGCGLKEILRQATGSPPIPGVFVKGFGDTVPGGLLNGLDITGIKEVLGLNGFLGGVVGLMEKAGLVWTPAPVEVQ